MGELLLSINKRFKYPNSEEYIIDELTLNINSDQWISIMGPSGCGKSTIIKLLSGLLSVNDSNYVKLNGNYINYKGESKIHKDIITVVQDCDRTLLPWKTVEKNIYWALKHGNKVNFSLDRNLSDIIESMDLKGLGNKYPHQLSSGQKQRLAVARALAFNAKILLLDEPFSSLDFSARRKLEESILRLKKFKISLVIVTHELEEALYLTDKIYVFSQKPTKIQYETEINIPRDAEYKRDRESDEFIKKRNEIHKVLNKLFNNEKE
jgi:NitT/TauT family transport system ATP-binding protein